MTANGAPWGQAVMPCFSTELFWVTSRFIFGPQWRGENLFIAQGRHSGSVLAAGPSARAGRRLEPAPTNGSHILAQEPIFPGWEGQERREQHAPWALLSS
jgi:hypothetical protein